MNRLRALIPIALLLLAATALSAQLPAPLRIHFIDVGQGDGMLIQGPSGHIIVYDGGEDPVRMRDYLYSLGVQQVGLAIASHNHTDHIGGFPLLVAAFKPTFYMDNAVPATTLAYARVLDAVQAAGSSLVEPTARRIALGEAAITIVPPPGIPDWDQNDNSVGMVVEYGAFRLSAAGDAEPREWAWWKTHQPDWLTPVHVHKASHHGSHFGDTDDALERLSPEVVVVSAGAENGYGHPSPEALSMYRALGAQVYRTDVHGTVIVEANPSGQYTVHLERGEEGPSPSPGPPACIDINTAGFEELQQIIHIGPSRAQQVIELRRVRRFSSVNELRRVSGIGEARLRDIIAEGKACVL